MITYVSGNLFCSPAQVLVNTVNTVGVMGKGVAREFKRIYPEMFTQYCELCESGQLDIGKLWLFKTLNKWILNFPTKKHWRSPSRQEYIEEGLKKFAKQYAKVGIYSIAFPPLGCGNGGLDFNSVVRPLMKHYLKDLPINAFIYPERNDPYPPEHTTPEEIKKWLQSEPEVLSFKEVWDDLRNILSTPQEFETLSQESSFLAVFVDDPKGKGIRIETKGKNSLVSYEKLLEFWQQLRRYGFSERKIIPAGLGRDIYYLGPIFAKLEYIKPVILSNKYQGRFIESVTGLQYFPKINPRRQQTQQLCFDI